MSSFAGVCHTAKSTIQMYGLYSGSSPHRCPRPFRHLNEGTVLLTIHYPRVLGRWHLENNFKNSLSYQILQVSLQEGKQLWRRWFFFFFLCLMFLSVFQDVRWTVCFIYKCDWGWEQKDVIIKRKEKPQKDEVGGELKVC